MLAKFTPAALLLLAAPLSAQVPAPLPKLNLEQETALRCSAVFGIIANEQARGIKSALAWPALGTRGREFFVQTTAALMDATGATQAQVQALFKARVEELQMGSMQAKNPAAYVRGVMQPCLSLLDQAIPPTK